jgi:hypothetical protein
MAANQYSAVTAQLVTELGALSGYSSVVVSRRIFRPSSLPAFTRYCIIVSPAPRPWDELRLGAGKIEYVFRVDLYLLVRRWEETDNPLFGTSAGNYGLFQMIEDVKTMLRLSTLGGLLDKTYDEPGGDSTALGSGGIEFQEIASPGFESDEFSFVHVAKVPYKARTVPFCHPRN